MIETCKLTKIYINDTKKDGTKLVDRYGKPFRKIAIQTDKHAGYLSDFIFREDDPKLQWQVGDEVEIIAYQNGDYKNFKVPTRLDRLELRIEALEDLLNSGKGPRNETNEARILSADDDIKVEDLPF